MSELLLSFLIAVGILAALFVFVPMLDICNDRCQRLLLRRRSSPQTKVGARVSIGLRNAA